MIGLSGLITPSLEEMAGVAAELDRRGLTLPLLIVYLLPNTAQVLDRMDPSLPFVGARDISRGVIPLRWRPGVAWGVAVGVLLFAGLAFVSRGGNSFVYFGF